MAAAGTMLGTTAVQVFSDQDDPVYATYRWIEFYHHESCGKCTPCREGCYWMAQVLHRILSGKGSHEDLDTLLDSCDNLLGRSFCASAMVPRAPYSPRSSTSSRTTWTTSRAGHRRCCPRPITWWERTDVTDVVKKVDTVTLTIDGIEVEAAKGELVIRVAERLGIAIRVSVTPAAVPGRRLPPVPGRHRGPAQAGRLLHPGGR